MCVCGPTRVSEYSVFAMAFRACILLGLFVSSSAYFVTKRNGVRENHWNSLKVRWSPDPNQAFIPLPLTSQTAVQNGWVKISDCTENSKFRGARYVKDGDEAIVVLYDVNGIVAGIQIGVEKSLIYGNPNPELATYVEDGDKYYITAYFVPTGTICTRGRTQDELYIEGTGTALTIQVGPNPERDLVSVPHDETGLQRTKWTKGKCVPTMGNHYWYNTHENTDCDRLTPVFLLYNSGRLNAFGWAMQGNLPSPLVEHPPKQSYGTFIENVPRCMLQRGTITTLHIYLSSTPWLNRC